MADEECRLDRDDGADLGDRLAERRLERGVDGGVDRRAGGARALEGEADGPVVVDVDQLDVAPVGDQGRSQRVEHLLDAASELSRHLERYRRTAGLR